ncbi:S1C family serine protease [Desmospora profundinema]|uniref:Serine protease Do n=1 Tax=Desmospora profundinema TaxID=1571184 RepID=A0ABU1IML0_9BACL|nr:trypsin-like peptidase domain-containing protein [Desmospora profundinema]MDR6225399.1 serine protease Do [Desmospora profundinema]
MGYYDNTDRVRRYLGMFLIALISAVIGGLLVLTISPALIQAGILPPQFFIGQNRPLAEGDGTEEQVSVDVQTNITKAVEKARPAVVGVVNLQASDDPFGREPVERGTGSGVIFEKKDGRAKVVTNQHVIEGATQVGVVIPDENGGKPVEAKVLGADKATDLAVLEMDDQHVQAVAEFGNSDKVKAGEPAIAIGNPLGLEFSQSVTAGVISSPHRTISVSPTLDMDVIQTDAAINPGNSGGALINTAGQVIGINSLKIAQQGIEGLGFAIPSNDAKPIINDLIQHGEVRRAFMGVSLRDVETISQQARDQRLNLPDEVMDGVVITDVQSGSPSARGGLESLDVIVQLDNTRIRNGSELRSYLWKKKSIGDQMEVTFYRNGEKQTTTITLQKQR